MTLRDITGFPSSKQITQGMKRIMAEKKVSQKEIMPMLEKLQPLAKEIAEIVESMPNCTRKKSLLVTAEHLLKKVVINESERGMSDKKVLEYINSNPEFQQKLAAAARSDEGIINLAKEVGAKVVTTEEKPVTAGKKKKSH
jgi:hypothetical protein